MKTAVLIKEYTDKLSPVITEQERHNGEVAKILGIDYANMPIQMRQKLYDKNMVWAIDERFVKKFKYVAGISSEVYYEPFEHKDYPFTHPMSVIKYVGDIPNFAIDRIRIAKDCGLKYFTIHSCKPLPIEEIFQQVDPVLVGWWSNPKIILEDTFLGKRFSEMDKVATGVIVAIWDMEKEIQILD